MSVVVEGRTSKLENADLKAYRAAVDVVAERAKLRKAELAAEHSKQKEFEQARAEAEQSARVEATALAQIEGATRDIRFSQSSAEERIETINKIQAEVQSIGNDLAQRLKVELARSVPSPSSRDAQIDRAEKNAAYWQSARSNMRSTFESNTSKAFARLRDIEHLCNQPARTTTETCRNFREADKEYRSRVVRIQAAFDGLDAALQREADRRRDAVAAHRLTSGESRPPAAG